MDQVRFEWDQKKDAANQRKHGLSFAAAQEVFFDPRRVIARDLKHAAPRLATIVSAGWRAPF